MARDKDKSVNPATAHLKAQKARQLKKGRAEALGRRNEKLARRNPERLQRQIEDFKTLESSGSIKPREKQILEELERDVKAIRKAREFLGDKAPSFGGGNHGPTDRPDRRREDTNNRHLRKRTHDGSLKPSSHHRRDPSLSSGSETSESIRRIPMPRDTPPPIPRRYPRHSPPPSRDTPHALPARPPSVAPVQTTYSSAPQVRNLQKEAVSRFVPQAVRQKIEAVKGQGKLVEPEEMDRLERSGYGVAAAPREMDAAQKDVLAGSEAARLAEEEERFRREMEMEAGMDGGDGGGRGGGEEESARNEELGRKESKHVEIEDVEDEDLQA